MQEFNQILYKVSHFIGEGITYKDFIIDFESGKSLRFSELENISVEETEENIFITAEMSGYKAKFNISKLEKGIFSFKAMLIPEGIPADKVHKITTAKILVPYNSETRLYVNHKFKEGVYRIEELSEECICRDFLAYYQISNPERAVTFTSKLPAKFKSEISILKDEQAFIASFSTTVPYTFEGEIICQEWILSVNMSVSDALIKNADSYACDKSFQNPVGWSTWDYYFTSATEDDVKENVDFIAADETLAKTVRYISLDDGWQQREGDWRSGIRYPSGLKSLVEYIRNKGFEAGIWIAPTRLHNLSGTVMRRNDFLVRDEYGDPVNDEDMFVLDPTHPDGEKFLRETFSYLADCGFTFYKLDFISNMLTCTERFYDKNAGPFDALARLLKIVRETVPKGSHVMGCSLPYGMGANVVDSRRTGLDIHNVWGHIKVCVSEYIPQFAANGKIYRNDLDYLIVRGADTSNDSMSNVINPKSGYNSTHHSSEFVWRKGTDFNYTEAKTWCNIILMTGSSIFLGDRLTLLNEKGIELLKKTVTSADFCAATPVFSADSIPEVWYKSNLGKLYIFNFTDYKKQYVVKLEELKLETKGKYADLFTQNEYELDDGILSISLDAHDSVCLEIKK